MLTAPQAFRFDPPALIKAARRLGVECEINYRELTGTGQHGFTGLHLWATGFTPDRPSVRSEVYVRVPVESKRDAMLYVLTDVLDQLGVLDQIEVITPLTA